MEVAAAQLLQQPPHSAPVDDSGTDTDDEGLLIRQAEALRQQAEASKPASFGPLAALAGNYPVGGGAKGKPAAKRPAGAVTLRTLLEAGLLQPGHGVLVVDYKGMQTYGDLTADGLIVSDGQSFESPSAFSIYIKRQVNPDRKADDGWKAVRYKGKLLEQYKIDLLNRLGSGTPAPADSGQQQPASFVAAGSTGPSPLPSTQNSPRHQPAAFTAPQAAAPTPATEEPSAKRQRMDAPATSLAHLQPLPTEAPAAAGPSGASAQAPPPLAALGAPAAAAAAALSNGAQDASKPALKIKLKIKGTPAAGGGGGGAQPPQPSAAAAAAAAMPGGNGVYGALPMALYHGHGGLGGGASEEEDVGGQFGVVGGLADQQALGLDMGPGGLDMGLGMGMAAMGAPQGGFGFASDHDQMGEDDGAGEAAADYFG